MSGLQKFLGVGVCYPENKKYIYILGHVQTDLMPEHQHNSVGCSDKGVSSSFDYLNPSTMLIIRAEDHG